MIRIDEIWLSTQPMDMRAGMDTAMAQVLRAFGSIKPHCAYLFCNKRGHRMKVLVHDGLGIWLCARRLEQGKFHWAQIHQGESVALSPEQLQALIQGLPWQGHYIVWLPKYSPDLNPIENMWSRVTAIRNKFRVKDIRTYALTDSKKY